MSLHRPHPGKTQGFDSEILPGQTTDLLTQAMTELSQTLTTDYRTAQGDYQRIQYIPVAQAGGSLAQPQHIQLQVVQMAPVRNGWGESSIGLGGNGWRWMEIFLVQ